MQHSKGKKQQKKQNKQTKNTPKTKDYTVVVIWLGTVLANAKGLTTLKQNKIFAA